MKKRRKEENKSEGENSRDSLCSDDLEVQFFAPLQDPHDIFIAGSEFSVERDFACVFTTLQTDQNPEMMEFN